MRTAPAATVLLAALVTAAPAVVAGGRTPEAVLRRPPFGPARGPAPAPTPAGHGFGALVHARWRG